MSDTNIAFEAIAPDENAEMSRMKPNARTTVSSIMPTRANNAALLRLMVKIIRSRKPEPLARSPDGPQERRRNRQMRFAAARETWRSLASAHHSTALAAGKRTPEAP